LFRKKPFGATSLSAPNWLNVESNMVIRSDSAKTKRSKNRRALRPLVDGLEDRMVPAVLAITPSLVGPMATTTGVTATQLVITSEAPSSVVAGAGFGITVKAENASGQVDTKFDGTVMVALAKNPGDSSLGGTLTATAKDGVATFSGLTLDRTGTGYTLKLTSASLTAATTTAIKVTNAVASKLVITSQPPAQAHAGTGFSLTVTAEDKFGNVASGFDGKVTVALGKTPAGVKLGGTLTVTASKGVATFNGLTITKSALDYTLTLSSGKMTVTSAEFNVVSAKATKLVVTAEPTMSIVAGTTFSVTITAEDQSGNVAGGFISKISLAKKSGPGTLGGTLTASAKAGVVTFTGINLSKAGSYVLQATSSGLNAVSTDTIIVTAVTA
jgi:hypothetical protein